MILLLLSALLWSGCTVEVSGEPDFNVPSPQLVAVANCAASGWEQHARFVGGIVLLLVAIENPDRPPVDVEFDPATGRFTVRIDFDEDTVFETSITGTATRSGVGDRGPLKLRESVDIQWLATGMLDGEGDYSFRQLTYGEGELRGTGRLRIDGDCGFELDAPLLSILRSGDEFQATGSLESTTRHATLGVMQARMDLDSGDEASVSGIYDNGEKDEIARFKIRLTDFVVIFEL